MIEKITIQNLSRIAKLKGYTINTHRGKFNANLNIWGIRTLDVDTSRYNDYIIIFRQLFNSYNLKTEVKVKSKTYTRIVQIIDNCAWVIDVFVGTTDPSKDNLVSPINKNGTAILKEGQYKGMFRSGKHHNDYEAFVQNRPCIVYRDNNKDGLLDYNGKQETGMFGINFHKASKWKIVDLIGLYSAGCQVVKSVRDYEDIIIPLKRVSEKEGFKEWDYTLINIDNLNGK